MFWEVVSFNVFCYEQILDESFFPKDVTSVILAHFTYDETGELSSVETMLSSLKEKSQ